MKAAVLAKKNVKILSRGLSQALPPQNKEFKSPLIILRS